MLNCRILKGDMLIFRNAEGVHGGKKVGNPVLVVLDFTRNCLLAIYRTEVA